MKTLITMDGLLPDPRGPMRNRNRSSPCLRQARPVLNTFTARASVLSEVSVVATEPQIARRTGGYRLAEEA
jgi:hypothetical protein